MLFTVLCPYLFLMSWNQASFCAFPPSLDTWMSTVYSQGFINTFLTNLDSVGSIFFPSVRRERPVQTPPLLCVILGTSLFNCWQSQLHPYIFFLSGCKDLLLNRPNSPLIYRSCKEYSTSHNLLLGGIQSQAVKSFMASPGGLGTQVAFSLPQLIK